MMPSEKVMQNVSSMTTLGHKITSIGHVVTTAEEKFVLLGGLRSEFGVIAGVIRATDKSDHDSICLLVIRETEYINTEGVHVLKSEQAFPLRISEREKTCHFCRKKGHNKCNCFKYPNGDMYEGNKKHPSNQKEDVDPSLLTFVAKIA